MAKNKNSPKDASGWLAWAKIVEAVLDRFGWPGFIVAYGIYFVQQNATLEQKRALIDLYLLGHGIDIYYPLILLMCLWALAFFAQRTYYRKKLAVMENELKRLGQWKSDHQEKQIGTSLHHSESGGK